MGRRGVAGFTLTSSQRVPPRGPTSLFVKFTVVAPPGAAPPALAGALCAWVIAAARLLSISLPMMYPMPVPTPAPMSVDVVLPPIA
ncbi:MAG: hypothetical protein U0575_15170 [Phycisphaerales bacterium]